MKTIAIGAFALAASLLTTTTAQAQSPAIWQGVYVGAHIGGGWGKLTGDGIDVTVDPKGVVGGVHGGYNWQSGTFVFGVEGDVSASGQSWSMTNGADTVKVESSYIATLRARAGIASGPALFYATGGVAFSNLKVSGNDGFGGFSFSDSGTGWVVGAGVEYMMSSNLALRVEGLHNRFNIKFNEDDPSGKYTVNVLRAGLSYKF
jgi:outer membrane immunogenic protein